jgi:hypothetical protein
MLDFIKEAGFPAIALLLGGLMVVVAIIRNIALEKVKIQLTASQSIQLAVVGVLFIGGGFALQYFPPNSPEESANIDVYSTLYALQTQAAQPTHPLGGTEQASIPSGPTSSIPPTATLPPNPFFTITPTLVPFTLTPDSSQPLEEVFCTNFYSIMVREGPNDNYPIKSIIENPNNLSNPDCLLFDFRMPDNSWLRIAPNQNNPNYARHEGGWVTSDQFRPIDFDKLRVYIPDNVKDGLYCVTSRYGLKVRSCPYEGCREIGTLSLQDCLFMDGRSSDGLWVRVSTEKNDDKYAIYEGNWVSTYFLAPFEFSAGYQPYFRYYFELLPSVEQIPTPNG